MAMIGVRLPEDLQARLDRLAKKTARPRSYYVKEALRAYLDANEEGYLALDRLADKNAEYLSSDEAKTYLGL
jgi:RHH-type rel operon transcriptional repressor/antitoxin RelB